MSIFRNFFVRAMLTALLVGLAGQVVLPARTYAANEFITLTPNVGTVGSSFTVTGSGFTGTAVTVYFNGLSLGTAAVSGGNLTNATFQVPNVLVNRAYSVVVYSANGPAPGFSQAALFSVVGTSSSLGNLSLSKYIQNGTSGFSACAASTGCTVQNQVGATETYAVQYQNMANAPISQLTITDTLQPGQSFVSATPGCVASSPSPTTALVTVTCTITNVPASPQYLSTNNVLITTQPVNGFTGVITNRACASEAGFIGQACSNTTYLTVGGNVVRTGTQICGLVSGYTPPSFLNNSYGLVTIGGQTFTIAPNAQISGAITTTPPNNNLCITFSFVNQAATVLTVTPNLAAVNVVCGVLGLFSATTSSILVGGINYPVTGSVMSGNPFVLGQTYCFLLQNNTIVGVLTGIPTEAHVGSAGGNQRTHMIAE